MNLTSIIQLPISVVTQCVISKKKCSAVFVYFIIISLRFVVSWYDIADYNHLFQQQTSDKLYKKNFTPSPTARLTRSTIKLHSFVLNVVNLVTLIRMKSSGWNCMNLTSIICLPISVVTQCVISKKCSAVFVYFIYISLRFVVSWYDIADYNLRMFISTPNVSQIVQEKSYSKIPSPTARWDQL